MTPLEFLARLSAIVPPPRYSLLRYAGVLGPRSSWRREVVPWAPQPKPCDGRPAEKEHEAPPRRAAESHAEPTATGTLGEHVHA